MYEIFAEILRGYGLKTADVSRATGISMSTFTDWKKGRGTPKADKMKKDGLTVPLHRCVAWGLPGCPQLALYVINLTQSFNPVKV